MRAIMASTTVGHCLGASLLQSVLSSKHPSCGRWGILVGMSADGCVVSVLGGPAIWLLQTQLYSTIMATHSSTAKSDCITLGGEDSCEQLYRETHILILDTLGHHQFITCALCSVLSFSHNCVSLMPTHNCRMLHAQLPPSPSSPTI